MTERKTKIALFLFFFFLYLLFLGDYSKEPFYSSDEMFYFNLTQSLAESGSLSFDSYLGYTRSKYAPAQSIAGLPFYYLGKVADDLLPGENMLARLSLVHLTNVVTGALLCLFFYQFGREMGYGRKASVAGTLVLGLATTFFPYAKQYFADPLAALFLLLTAMFLWRSFTENRKTAIYAGIFFGGAFLTKIDHGLLFFPLAAVLLFMGKDRLRRTGFFMAGIIPMAILSLVYNYLNYGNAFTPGYGKQGFTGPFFSSMFGLLFSPGRGLFIYSAPVIAAFFGLRSFFRKNPPFTTAILVIAASKIIILSKWFSWQGGWCWGPRLLLPVLPLLLLPLFEVFEKWQTYRRGTRILLSGIIVCGFLSQIPGVMVSPNKYHNDIWGMMQGEMNEFLFIPQLSHLSGNWFLLKQGQLDLLWLEGLRSGSVLSRILFALVMAGSLFTGVLVFRETGLGKKGWTERLIPQFKRLLIPLGMAIVILLISHLIFLSQGLKTESGGKLYHTYIEHPRIPGKRPDTANFYGHIDAPVEGDFRFHMKVRGTYHILIDGKPILSSNEDLPQHWDYAEVFLEKGQHDISGRYTPRRDSDISLMHLYWTIPDNAIYKSIIGPEFLYTSSPGPLHRLLAMLARFRWWLVLIILLLSQMINDFFS